MLWSFLFSFLLENLGFLLFLLRRSGGNPDLLMGLVLFGLAVAAVSSMMASEEA